MTHARIVTQVIRWAVALLALLAAAEVAAGEGVKGRVLDPEGNAVKGAKVYAMDTDADYQEVLKGSTTADDKGEFVFANMELSGGHRPQLVAVARGFGIGTTSLRDKPTEIRLTHPIEVTVPFVDEEGKAVRDLLVRTHALGLGGGMERFNLNYVRPAKGMPVLSGRTDGNGEVRFKEAPRGGKLWLAVDDERFARLSYDTIFILSNEEVMRASPIKLMKAASVKGRLLYENGKPARGIEVSGEAKHPTSGWSSGLTDDEGFYELKKLGAGDYFILPRIKDVELRKSWCASPVQIKLSAGEQKRDVDLKLISGGVIKGKVIAEDNAEPLKEMSVGVYAGARLDVNSPVVMTRTEADGGFLFRVPPGDHYLYLAMGMAPEGFALPAQKNLTVSVAEGQTVEVDFKLPRGPKIPLVSGRVVDEDGKPVGDCAISIEPSGKIDHSAFAYEAQSAADGSFQFKLRYAEVKVRAKKEQMATLAAVVVKGKEDQHIDLKLETNALAGIGGTVVDSKGDLVVGAKIQLSISYGSIGFGHDTASTGKEGTFRIDGLWPDGSYDVVVSAQGRAEYKTYGLQMKPGEILDLGKLEVKDLDSFVSGTVFDSNGNPAAGVRVSINGTNMTPNVGTQTDKDGKFRIPVVSGDTFDLFVTFGEGAITSQKVTAGDADLQIFQRARKR